MKTQELAKTDESNANAKQDLEDTKNSLSADEEFLMMLKEKCSMTDKEWEERQKTRQLEMEACSKAMAILNSDDSFNLFTKTSTRHSCRSGFLRGPTPVSKHRRSSPMWLAGIVVRNWPRWRSGSDWTRSLGLRRRSTTWLPCS